jgi:hypothetical protein
MVRPLAVNQRLCEQSFFTFDVRIIEFLQASFFTSIDSVLFSLASSKDRGTSGSKLMLASLVGALIFHAATGKDFEQNLCFLQLTVLPIWLSHFGLRCVFCPYPLQAE